MKSKTKTITLTAVCLAMLIVVQLATRTMPQLVTGSLVNSILIITVLTAGTAGGILTAIISPFLAFLLGIGPKFLPFVPIISLGNFAIIIIFAFIMKRLNLNSYLQWGLAIVLGAAIKFTVLFFGIVKGVLPILVLPKNKSAVIAASFGATQLITALIGGIIAFIIVSILKKRIR